MHSLGEGGHTKQSLLDKENTIPQELKVFPPFEPYPLVLIKSCLCISEQMLLRRCSAFIQEVMVSTSGNGLLQNSDSHTLCTSADNSLDLFGLDNILYPYQDETRDIRLDIEYTMDMTSCHSCLPPPKKLFTFLLN